MKGAFRNAYYALDMGGIVALVLVPAAIAVASQQDRPSFRSGIDVVHFTVTVLDKDRRPVTGLTAADFEVLVDGKPRPLAAFAAVTLPDDTSTPPRNGIADYELTARMPGQSGQYVAAIEASDGRHAERREIFLTVR